MNPGPPRPWPLAPLTEHIARTLGIPVHHPDRCTGCHGNSTRTNNGEPVCLTIVGLARTIGVHSNQIYRWTDIGLTDDQADHLAVAHGTHPSRIWGDAWRQAGLTVLDELHLYGTPTSEPGWRQAAGYTLAPATSCHETAA